MVRGKGMQTKEILSDAEKESLVDQKQELEETLKMAEDYGKGTAAEQIDKTNLRMQIKRIEHAIDSRSAPRLTDKSRDSLWRELKELEERFKEGLPTRFEMDHPAKCPGAVRKHLGWLSRNEELIPRYRYILRALGEYRSIEQLRKEK